MKKIILGILFTLTNIVFANPNGEDAKVLVEKQAKIVLDNLTANESLYKSNPKAFSDLISKEVLPHLDFNYMGKFVLGKSAKSIDTKKQKEFIEAFRDFLVRAYSKGWGDYAGSDAKVLNSAIVSNNRTSLNLQVKNKNGKKEKINFALSYKNDAWKIYDVKFENVSFLLSYRNSFENTIKNEGIDSLIEKLQSGNIKE